MYTQPESPEQLLEELRRRPGWWYYWSDLDGLAQRALAAGCLTSAYEIANAGYWAAMSGSSNSSCTVVVYGPGGRTEDDEAFLMLLRRELLAALADH